MAARDSIIGAIAYSIGDDELTDYDGFEQMNLIEEYDLDLHAMVGILQEIHTRLGIYVPPREVETHDMNTVDKIVALVETYE